MRAFWLLSWIPAATWVGMRAYVGQYDGWGAWAAAPLLLVPVAVSAVFVGIGLVLAASSATGRPVRGDWIAIGVAALPLMWIALRLVAS